MRTFYKDEENPYDYTTDTPTVTVLRDEEKEPIPTFMNTDILDKPSTNYINWDSTKQTVVGNLDRSQTTGCVASNNLKISANNITSSAIYFSGTVYIKRKEIRCSFGGTIKTSFSVKDNTAGTGGNSAIYINGVIVGTPHNATSIVDYVVYTDTISLNASDLVQVYTQEGGGQQVLLKDFMISFDRTQDGDGVILLD